MRYILQKHEKNMNELSSEGICSTKIILIVWILIKPFLYIYKSLFTIKFQLVFFLISHVHYWVDVTAGGLNSMTLMNTYSTSYFTQMKSVFWV